MLYQVLSLVCLQGILIGHKVPAEVASAREAHGFINDCQRYLTILIVASNRMHTLNSYVTAKNTGVLALVLPTEQYRKLYCCEPFLTLSHKSDLILNKASSLSCCFV